MSSDYLVTPADHHHVNALQRFIELTNGIVAGGVFKDIMISDCQSYSTASQAKDIDIYFTSTEDYEKALEGLTQLKLKLLYDSNNSTGFYLSNSDHVIDLVKTPYSDIESIIRSFDFTVTKIAMYLDEHGEYMTMKHKDYDHHVKTKTLYYGDDHTPQNHHHPLERMNRYVEKYQYNLPAITLRKALEGKVPLSWTLRGITADQIVDAGMKSAIQLRQWDLNMMREWEFGTEVAAHLPEQDKTSPSIDDSPATTEESFSALTHFAHVDVDLLPSGSLSDINRYREMDFERSIYQNVKYSMEASADSEDTLDVHRTLKYAESVFGTQLIESSLLSVAPTAIQHDFVKYLTTLKLTHEEFDPLLESVFGTLGFLSKYGKHQIYCKSPMYRDNLPSVPLTHHCNHHRGFAKSASNTLAPDLRRDEEAEIMWRILTMHDSTKWHQKVSAYFNEIISNEFRVEFMTFFEWEDAMKNSYFNAELPYNLMLEIAKEDDQVEFIKLD